MKKLSILICLLSLSLSAFAVDIGDRFVYNSRFWENRTYINFRPAYAFSIGGEFGIAEHDYFKNHLYAIRLPMTLLIRETSLSLRPFYYPSNGNGASAWGGRVDFSAVMNNDEVEKTSSRIFLGASFASQEAPVTKYGATNDDTFRQMVYQAGVSYDFFGTYGFEASLNTYQYLSGLSGVEHVAGVLNQQDLADLSTLDYVLPLPKGSAGFKMSWVSDVSRSTNFIGYRYIKFERARDVHSLLLSSTVQLTQRGAFNLSYNHLFSGGGGRDLYGASITIKF